MTKTIKLKDNTYWDTKGIMHNKKLLNDILYPVGSIYMSVNNTNPSTLFGGTWEQITGRFLYCTNTSKTTGGSNTTGSAGGGNTGSTALSIEQIPYHDHQDNSYYGNPNSRRLAQWNVITSGDRILIATSGSSSGYPIVDMVGQGGGKGHTHTINAHTHTQNLPPYFTVYCWYRTK